MSRMGASDRMKAAADHMAGSVDRVRDSEQRRALQAAADTRAAHIAAFPCANEDEAVRTLRSLAKEVHARLVDFQGPLAPASLYASIARYGAEIPANPHKANARQAAEAHFTKPANDEGEE